MAIGTYHGATIGATEFESILLGAVAWSNESSFTLIGSNTSQNSIDWLSNTATSFEYERLVKSDVAWAATSSSVFDNVGVVSNNIYFGNASVSAYKPFIIKGGDVKFEQNTNILLDNIIISFSKVRYRPISSVKASIAMTRGRRSIR